MRKLVVSTYMSLDGVIDNPMWTVPYWHDEINQFQTDDLFASDALLLGKDTYEGFASAWPGRTDEQGFADRINTMPKYVISTTLDKADWDNSTIIRSNVVEEISKLKQQPGKNILKYGGGQLLQTLFQHNLLDELHLLIYPVTVGKGARLVPDESELTLQLTDTRTFPTGVVALIYKPAEQTAAQ